jgi:tetratricopeptide (TPR) repeat protein
MHNEQDDELVMSLVELAQSQPSDVRETYLRAACGDDAELFRQVWHYVRWNQRMQDFLVEPLYPALREHRFKPRDLLLDRFRIVREVAQGGMGIVYEARDERLGRRIALKCAKSGFRKRLPPEVRHASEISHPHVCKIFEIHTAPTTDGEIDFLTMEFLEGETLAARLQRCALHEDEARTIARQICAGLAEAHRNGVVHGDLKSNNVILTHDASGGLRAVITDFGLARKPTVWAENAASPAPGTAGSSQAGGALDYMAPELWKGEKPSAASDVYALGVILYELAAGRRPYPAVLPWLDRVKHNRPPLRHRWESIVQRCLDPDSAKRYPDAGEVEAALKPSPSRWWWMGSAAAIVLAAVSGVVTYQRATAPKESVRLVMLPLKAGPDEAKLAEKVSHDTAEKLARLKGGRRVRLSFAGLNAVASRHVDTIEKADVVLGATHVVQGAITHENGRLVVQARLTEARNKADNANWSFEYAPGEPVYAPTAITGMVSAYLRLPVPPIRSVNTAATQDYNTGLIYTRRNSTIDSALPLFERAVAADRGSPLTWAALAEAQYFKFFLTKDRAWLDRAGRSLRQAQNRDLDLAPVHRVAGVLMYDSGDFEQAQAEFERALDLEPASGETYRRLGQAYDKKGQLDQSLAAFRKATELDANSIRAWQSLGTFYYDHGKYSEAAGWFEKCVRMEPHEESARRALGTAYNALSRYTEAERELRAAIALAETPAALNNLANALTSQGKDQEAIPILNQALALSPGQYLWWMNLGSAYARIGQSKQSARAYQGGLELIEREMSLHPRDGVLRSRLAFLCARLGYRNRAKSEIEQALKLSPLDQTTRLMAVQVFEAIGKRDEALALLKSFPNEVLRIAGQSIELADLRKDPRFNQLLDLNHNRR